MINNIPVMVAVIQNNLRASQGSPSNQDPKRPFDEWGCVWFFVVLFVIMVSVMIWSLQ